MMAWRRGPAAVVAALLLSSGTAWAVEVPPGAEEIEVTEAEVVPEVQEDTDAEPELIEANVVAGEQVLVLTGPLRVAVTEAFGGSLAHDHTDGEASTEQPGPSYSFYAETTEGIVRLAEEDLPPGVLPGQGLAVTVTAPAGETVTEALALLRADDRTATVVDVAANAAATDPDAPLAAASAPALTGTRNVVVLPVQWSEAPIDATGSQLATMVNGAKAYWERNSGGRLTLTASVRGVRTITNLEGLNTCYWPNIEELAMRAHGVTASASTHYVVYLPRQSGCNPDWSAVSWIGENGVVLRGVTDVDALAHELGHNFGLGHAELLDCYDDTWKPDPIDEWIFSGRCRVLSEEDETDVMGLRHPAVSFPNGWGNNPGTLNAASAAFLGWTSLREVDSLRYGQTIDVLAVQNYTGLRALRAPTSVGNLYLEYRPDRAPDTYMSDWSGVQVRLGKPSSWGYTTFLLDLQPKTNYASRASHHEPQLLVGRHWTIPESSYQLVLVSQDHTRASLMLDHLDSSKIDHYVQRVYSHLFHRFPDEVGRRTWVHQLLTGTPRAAVADSITASREYRARLVRASYQTYLGRAPETTGLRNWLDRMGRGLTIQEMEAGFLGSVEYFRKAGGTPEAWVRQLYRHVLGRGATAAEVDSWVRQLDAGRSRERIALGFLMSREHLAAVIDGYYREYLGRGIDPRGRDTWVGKIQRGARIEQVIGEIIASNEYFNKT